MKKLLTIVCVVLFVSTLVLAGCGGGDNPVSLAKQTYQLFQKDMKAAGEKESGLAFVMWGLKMSQEPTPEFEKLTKKVENLSETSKKIYQETMEKLLGEKGDGPGTTFLHIFWFFIHKS
jgi:spermidine/putrescine-binding protein